MPIGTLPHLSLHQSGHDSSDQELQVDIMRFLAILAICLMAVFALVQSLPQPEAPEPQADLEALQLQELELNRKALQAEVEQLGNTGLALAAELEQLRLARRSEQANLTQVEEQLAERNRLLQQDTRQLQELEQARQTERENLRRIEQQLAKREQQLRQDAQRLQALEQKRLAESLALQQVQARRSSENIKLQQLQSELALARRVQQQRKVKSKAKPLPTPNPHPKRQQLVKTETPPPLRETAKPRKTPPAPRSKGVALQFASPRVLRRLVASGQVGFYARTEAGFQRLSISAGRESFQPAPAPDSLYVMAADTVPQSIRHALKHAPRQSLSWGVTLPTQIAAGVRRQMQSIKDGLLIINADGSVSSKDGSDA